MIEQALIDYLAADAALTDGTTRATVWAIRAPQGRPLPRVHAFRIDGVRPQSLDGPTGQCKARVQCDCLGASYGAGKTLADRLRKSPGGGGTRLEKFRGLMGAFVVERVLVSDDRDSYEPPAHADEAAVYTTSVDLEIWYRET